MRVGVCALVVRPGHGRLATAQISRFFLIRTLSTALLKKSHRECTPSTVGFFDLRAPSHFLVTSMRRSKTPNSFPWISVPPALFSRWQADYMGDVQLKFRMAFEDPTPILLHGRIELSIAIDILPSSCRFSPSVCFNLMINQEIMTYHSPPPARPVAGGVTVRANHVLTIKPIQLNELIETPLRELPVWRTKRFRGPRTCWRSQSCNSTQLDIK